MNGGHDDILCEDESDSVSDDYSENIDIGNCDQYQERCSFFVCIIAMFFLLFVILIG